MKVLVTAIGSMSAECVIESLRHFGAAVVGTDIYPREYHPISNMCHSFHQVPRAIPDAGHYCRTLKKIAENEGCVAIIPLTDPEVDAVSENRSVFERAGVRVWLSDDKVIKTVRNKDLWSQMLAESKNFKTIPSYTAYSDLQKNHKGDFVAKKVDGRSSEGILFSNTNLFRENDASYVDYIFQPKIEGDVLTVDFAIHPISRQLVCVPRIELMRTKNGAGTVVKIVDLGICEHAVREIADRLGLTGVMNCEFICGKDGIYLMDINPRFSAGVSFSKMAGYDFVEANVRCYCAQNLRPWGNLDVGSILVKRFLDFRV